MKFGETLYQRSTPEWAINNVDYNDLKHLLKVRTSNPASRAEPITIKNGSARTTHKQLEDEFFAELVRQHERVNDFIRVKAGELSRRLTALESQVSRLRTECLARPQRTLSGRRSERFNRLQANITRAGDDIQALSRFANANNLAFLKILKKFRKWTGSRALDQRFRLGVLDQPTSFAKEKFESLFGQFQIGLDLLRSTYFDLTFQESNDPSELKPSKANGHAKAPISCATKLQDAFHSGKAILTDNALATVPLGPRGCRACYWVHSDNLLNLQILLLQHMSELKESSIQQSEPPSTRSSRRTSPARPSSASSASDSINMSYIMCDDVQKFAEQRSCETVGDTELQPGKSAERATVVIRLSASEQPLVTLKQSLDQNTSKQQPDDFSTANVDRSILRAALTHDRVTPRPQESSKSHQRLLTWLSTHRDVQPLLKVSAHRCRYYSHKNSTAQGLWAVLDTHIAMEKCDRDCVAHYRKALRLSHEVQQGAYRFPHALLEVRIEGASSLNLLKDLDESHLVERVRGFSLETHGVALLWEPSNMPPPYWLAALKQDIRKLPTAPSSRPGTAKTANETTSAHYTSSLSASSQPDKSGSGFSPLKAASSATSAPSAAETVRPKMRKKFRRLARKKSAQSRASPSQQRYWNEFDDGSECEAGDAYAIYVEPDTPSAMSTFFHSINEQFRRLYARLRARHSSPSERDPLLDNTSSHDSPDDSDFSSSDVEAATLTKRRLSYSTFPSTTSSREGTLLSSTILAFSASLILLLISFILLATGRRKRPTPKVDTGIVIGVTTALMFAVVGVGSMVARRERMGWVYRACVSLAAVVVGASGVGMVVAMTQ